MGDALGVCSFAQVLSVLRISCAKLVSSLVKNSVLLLGAQTTLWSVVCQLPFFFSPRPCVEAFNALHTSIFWKTLLRESGSGHESGVRNGCGDGIVHWDQCYDEG